ncbi:MAG TPA: alpha-galactosidase [Candidatus Limnocylindrales bacterium]|nr:alpha-galactosidase [Candidatus Limnocylindrales bacterium]
MTAAAEFDAEARVFHLHNGLVSYLLRVLDDGSLAHVHFGAPLASGAPYGHLAPPADATFENRLGAAIPLELPSAGRGDYRVPAIEVVRPDGSRVLALRYVDHRIEPGKPALEGLPSTYVESPDEAVTLTVRVSDEPSGIDVELTWTLFADRPVVSRGVRVRNAGSEPVRVETLMSATLELPDADWTLVHLAGGWAGERHVVEEPLTPGRHGIGSTRGGSSHQHNPFLALRRTWTTEAAGEAYALSLVYSGNFLAEAEVDEHAAVRARIGLHPDTFAWHLDPGDSFSAPEAVLAWSGTGLAALSDALHDLFRSRLARGPWRDRPRPVLLNNWEATYFDFDEARLVEIASRARDLGVELFVLDDGWFGRRDDDTSSLGDWFVDRRKLPNGIDGLARRIEALGLRFGIWIEPEMVSERSELFRAHPGWAIGVPGRPRTEGRNQYVLDMGRPEVVDHLFGVLAELLGSAPISYVKWDWNRYLTEPFGVPLPAHRQGEFFHRYALGLYDLYRRLTEAFPEVLFESCAGGGGRFDPGLLAFAPQAWTSDDTDAIERLRIQWGTSLAYPLSSMGAHVSAVPNHQVGRVTPLATRAAVAFFGVFGYELDVTRFTDEERRAVADQVRFYKTHRELFQYGRFRRLRSPFEGERNVVAWMVLAEDARTAIMGTYVVLNPPAPGSVRVRPVGLDPDARYRIDTWPDRTSGREGIPVRGGDELMAIGLDLGSDRWDVAGRGDFAARLFVLRAE